MYLIDHVAELRFVNRFIYAIKRIIYTHHEHVILESHTYLNSTCFPEHFDILHDTVWINWNFQGFGIDFILPGSEMVENSDFRYFIFLEPWFL